MKKITNCAMAMVSACLLLTTACAPVKAWQKGKINDAEMVLGSRKLQKTEMSFQSYREGASGANGGKTGGGCGCN